MDYKTRLKILLYEHSITVKCLVKMYPRVRGGVGITRARYYMLLKADPKKVYETVKRVLQGGTP